MQLCLCPFTFHCFLTRNHIFLAERYHVHKNHESPQSSLEQHISNNLFEFIYWRWVVRTAWLWTDKPHWNYVHHFSYWTQKWDEHIFFKKKSKVVIVWHLWSTLYICIQFEIQCLHIIITLHQQNQTTECSTFFLPFSLYFRS